MNKINKIKRFMCILLTALLLVSNITETSLKTVYAAELGLLFGKVAIDNIMMNLFISTGVSQLGGTDALPSDKEVMTALREHFEYSMHYPLTDADRVLSVAYNGCKALVLTLENEMITPDWSYSTDFGVTFKAGTGTALKIALNTTISKACRDVVAEFIGTEANTYTNAYVDKSIPSSVSGSYPKTVNYTAHAVLDVKSIDDIDVYYGSDGVADFIKNKGYDDTNSSVFALSGTGRFDFLIVPFGYSYINGRLMLNEYFDDLMSDYAGYYSDAQFGPFFDGNCVGLDDYCFTYHYSTREILSCSQLSFNIADIKNFVSFNHSKSVSEGSFWKIVEVNDSAKYMNISDITFDVSDKYLTYDESSSKSYSDDVEYELSEALALSGFSAEDLASLMDAVADMSEQLKDLIGEQTQNQEELIQQGKDTLSALNLIHSVIHTNSGMLGEIAATVVSMPNLFRDLFSTFPTITEVTQLIDGIPADIANTLHSVSIFPVAQQLEAALLTIPASIARELVTVFPRADEIADTVIALPGEIADTLSGISITIPEVKIPEIVIPDIVIPEIAVPDVAVTLNPAITIQNDYAGLADAIALQIEGVLTKVFIPDQALTLQKVAYVKSYFGFIDDFRTAIDTIVNKLLGITPVPYLKIPLGRETSEYNYGFGEYFIIDCSWYAAYKSFGDKIILAICWATFLWKIFMKLPGIISGTEGSIGKAYNSYNKYISGKDG